jgi:biotin/methionine sulfoxide reductase
VLLDATNPECRIAQPLVRQGYLEGTPNNRANRGQEPLIPVDWDTALDLAAAALKRTISTKGNEAVFGGSYGWASAGRFHHAPGQLHRFLNCVGGYVRSVNTYSSAAAEVIMRRATGLSIYPCSDGLLSAEDIPTHCDLHLAFGGTTPKNHQVVPGGMADHRHGHSEKPSGRGRTRILNIGPNRDDVPAALNPEWIPLRPGSDAALMLALAHQIEVSGRVDREFLETHTVGYERFRAYLLGQTDGQAKNPAWAAPICGLSADAIAELAETLGATENSAITVALSLQRAEHGEQPFWLALTLACMLGTLGKTGCGVGVSWGSNGTGQYNRRKLPFKWAAFPQGKNPVSAFIPVARIADMLLNPGAEFDYDGQRHRYADIDLVWWAGGNPFHHHQDLHRLREAFQRPETVIVNDFALTATAQHADIVFPATTALERNDIASGKDPFLTPSQRVIAPYGQARSDYEIFTAISERMGVRDEFTEGLDESGWLQRLYQTSCQNAALAGITLPDFETFWAAGQPLDLTEVTPAHPLTFETFRDDPASHPLPTPSGKVEIFSQFIDEAGYADCLGHPAWFPKTESLAADAPAYPINLLSSQPPNKLHSQFARSRHCMARTINGHERVAINPSDAAKRNIADGDIVTIFNDRGRCLAAAELTPAMMPGVASLPTGAWFLVPGWGRAIPEQNGNPNAVTRDVGTSSLAQGPTAQSCLVDIKRVTD